MKKHLSNHQNRHLISNYGRIFRRNLSKKIIDIDESINIDFDFQIHRVEDLIKEFNGVIPPNRISQNMILLIEEGAGEKTIGSHKIKIEPDMVLIIPKRGIHSSSNRSIEGKGFMLSFNDDLFLKMNLPGNLLKLQTLFKTSRIPYRHISKELTGKLAELFEAILLENKKSCSFKSELLCIKIAEIIIYCHRIFETEQIDMSPHNALYENFVNLLEENFINEKSVQFYADSLLVHPNHLNSVIKKITGLSVKKNIQNRLILEAKYLLASTSLTIKEVSYELNFENQNSFSRFFKNSEKISAKEYRDTIL